VSEREGVSRRMRVVLNIFTRVQCFTSYLSVQSGQHQEVVPELMHTWPWL